MEIEFENKWFDLVRRVESDILITIDRRLKTQPFIGMKQPSPSGSMMGYEAFLQLLKFGQPLISKWKLYKGDDLVQKGETNEYGYSYNLNIEMPKQIVNYKLVIFNIN